MEFTHYKFEQHEGLPPDGEAGQFFGFDATGRAYMLRWVDRLGHRFWLAVGFDGAKYLGEATPVVFTCDMDRADFITHWSHAPVVFDDEPVPA